MLNSDKLTDAQIKAIFGTSGPDVKQAVNARFAQLDAELAAEVAGFDVTDETSVQRTLGFIHALDNSGASKAEKAATISAAAFTLAAHEPSVQAVLISKALCTALRQINEFLSDGDENTFQSLQIGAVKCILGDEAQVTAFKVG